MPTPKASSFPSPNLLHAHPQHLRPCPPCRHFHLNQLVRVDGVVTRRTGVFPQLHMVMFDCLKCGALLGPYYQQGTQEIKLMNCGACASKGPFQVSSGGRRASFLCGGGWGGGGVGG
jgi:DNA replicative helicase MCM subunit Mcm2 (Cdc46/Mcm family)